MRDVVQLLSKPTNYAVVQLPGRNYPGVVFQGDSLHSLVHRLREVRQMIEDNQSKDSSAELDDICEQLSEALVHYETICGQRGIGLPYPIESDQKR